MILLLTLKCSRFLSRKEMSFTLNKYSSPFIFVRCALIVLLHIFANNTVDFLCTVAKVSVCLWSSLMDPDFQLAEEQSVKISIITKHCQYDLISDCP